MSESLNKLRPLFDHIIVCDFEFQPGDGERQIPNAMCFRDLFTGREGRYRKDELEKMSAAPFPVGDRSLFVCHAATAEIGCFLPLGWEIPEHIYDTYIEEKNIRMGLDVAGLGFGLVDTMRAYCLETRDKATKQKFQTMGATGGPQCEEDWGPYLDYCADDVDEGAAVFIAQITQHDINIPQACMRGEYMAAAAQMEYTGIPIDVPLFEHMKAQWPSIRHKIVDVVNPQYQVYVDGKFSTQKFHEYLVRTDTPWPVLHSGALDLTDATFRNMAKAYSHIGKLRECRHALSSLNLFENITVGHDGRNRTWLNPSGSRSNRNQPSNSKFIFGTARSHRSLIRPEYGHSLAYLDFKSQEWLVGAALSGDPKMLSAYATGDVYLAFAIQAGAAPEGATKATHREIRNLFKACVLGVQYGMGEYTLAGRIGGVVAEARELLRLHRLTYPVFWSWVDGAIDHAFYHGSIQTKFGWTYHIPPADENGIIKANPRSVQNFPCQAHGAEMLRLACVYLTQAGIEVCCPVHDAVLIHMPTENKSQVIAHAKQLMAEASIDVVGHECMIDEYVVDYPNHYVDEDGAEFWQTLLDLAGPVPE